MELIVGFSGLIEYCYFGFSGIFALIYPSLW